jgi:hypothetical protein
MAVLSVRGWADSSAIEWGQKERSLEIFRESNPEPPVFWRIASTNHTARSVQTESIAHVSGSDRSRSAVVGRKFTNCSASFLFIIPSHYTRALWELEMLRSCINFNYVFYRSEASRTSQASFFDRVSGFWIFTRLMQSYRDGPMGTCNILHDVWNRKSTQSLFILFFILVTKPKEVKEEKFHFPNLTIWAGIWTEPWPVPSDAT